MEFSVFPLKIWEHIFDRMEVGTLEDADRLGSVSSQFKDLVNRKFKIQLTLPIEYMEDWGTLKKYPDLKIVTLYYGLFDRTYLYQLMSEDENRENSYNTLNLSALKSLRLSIPPKDVFFTPSLKYSDEEYKCSIIKRKIFKYISSPLQLKELQMEFFFTADLEKDVYFLRNVLGAFKELEYLHIYFLNGSSAEHNAALSYLTDDYEKLRGLYVYNIIPIEESDITVYESLEILDLYVDRPYNYSNFNLTFTSYFNRPYKLKNISIINNKRLRCNLSLDGFLRKISRKYI